MPPSVGFATTNARCNELKSFYIYYLYLQSLHIYNYLMLILDILYQLGLLSVNFYKYTNAFVSEKFLVIFLNTYVALC